MKDFVKCLLVLMLVVWGAELKGAEQSESDTAKEEVKVTAAPVLVEAPEEKDPDRVLVTLNGITLKGWEVDTMLANRAGRDQLSAIDLWIDIQLKAAEARRRGLDKSRESQFILKLFQDNYLSGTILTQHLEKDIPEVTEEQARAKYAEDIKRYQRPMQATVQRITVMERDKANKILEEARKEGADFAKLISTYSQNKDKKKNQLKKATYEKLKGEFGKEAADAVKAAKKGEVLGPFVGLKGFEVVKVDDLTAAETFPFERVKDGILRQLNNEAQTKQRDNFLNELKAQSKIEESAEVTELRAKPKQAAPGPGAKPARRPPPGRSGRSR